MKKSIFTIALLFSIGTTFSQEPEAVTLPKIKHVIIPKGTGTTNSKIIISDSGLF